MRSYRKSFNKKSPIPPFLRYGIDKYQIGQPPVYFSHFEGWGLYAESMGFEMGLYEDSYQKLGFYSWNLLRASRLVVDTGIHAFGWGRQRAIDYLLENTLMSKHNAEGQIDR